jgi:hypothetical protein
MPEEQLVDWTKPLCGAASSQGLLCTYEPHAEAACHSWQRPAYAYDYPGALYAIQSSGRFGPERLGPPHGGPGLWHGYSSSDVLDVEKPVDGEPELVRPRFAVGGGVTDTGDKPAGELRPDYYTNASIEPWEVIKRAPHLDYWTATAVKYILRAGTKPSSPEVEDLRKAYTFIGEKIRMLEEEEHPLYEATFSEGSAPPSDEPRLGLATTRQLMEELHARIEVDGRLDYRTVDGG